MKSRKKTIHNYVLLGMVVTTLPFVAVAGVWRGKFDHQLASLNSDLNHNNFVVGDIGKRNISSTKPDLLFWRHLNRLIVKRQTDDEYESDRDCVGPGKWLAKAVYVNLPIRIPCDPW